MIHETLPGVTSCWCNLQLLIVSRCDITNKTGRFEMRFKKKITYHVNYFLGFIVALQSRDPQWYASMMSPLTKEENNDLQQVFMIAEQRTAAAGRVGYPCKHLDKAYEYGTSV